ncbi:hypothetical protein HMPREF1051_1350 [Neisseria sicca VK64]|uniref:Uncharacterized protein n=1 Tax=Neisseria sicca VK64 TaxID=1095748 RepID=I2NG04_NEISI|nr:hypothetical protein HMPREF1051_1350 [Neisseria sicca VK64]
MFSARAISKGRLKTDLGFQTTFWFLGFTDRIGRCLLCLGG